MGKAQSATAPVRVGDWARVPFGPRKVEARVVEDRGPVGAGGRHLIVVDIPTDAVEPLRIEVPFDEVETVEPAARRVDKARSIQYLKQGGLLAILRSGTSGGRHQPRVWLRNDTRGNITHTFTEDYGQIGGRQVPFRVLHDDKIFVAKADEVRSFLSSFGLSTEDVNEVIATVGTAP